MHLKTQLVLFITFVAFATTYSAITLGGEHPTSHSAAHWGYAGSASPSHWGDLKGEYRQCKAGKAQSPIDVAASVTRKPASESPIEFHYNKVPLEVIDNGHTVQVNFPEGSKAKIRGQEYHLVQFHFHSPSEHTLNGWSYPLEIHLVHKDAQGKLAVVGILAKEGESNPLLEAVFRHTPNEKGEARKYNYVEIDPMGLLPKDRNYFHYTGSLTTPPCSEGVNWNLFQEPVEVSTAQLEMFNKKYYRNARPVQPVNGRNISSY